MRGQWGGSHLPDAHARFDHLWPGYPSDDGSAGVWKRDQADYTAPPSQGTHCV